MTGTWLEVHWTRDGSGTYRYHGRDFKIIRDKGVGYDKRVAKLNGVEIARAGKFPVLLRKLDAWCAKNPVKTDGQG